MRRGIRAFVAIALVALVAVAGERTLRALHGDGAAAPPQAPDRDDAPVRLPKAVEPAPKPVAAAHDDGPLGETIERLKAQRQAGPDDDFRARREALERRTAAGDVGASAELGKLMLSCEFFFDLGEGDVEAVLVEGIARFGKEALELPESIPLDAAVDSAKRVLDEQRKLCRGASGLELSTDERRRALDLLRQGARAGDAGAMATFGLHAFADFADRRAMIADPQAVRDRKREALRYLERAIAAGHLDALWIMADAYAEGAIVDKSHFLAYAHYYAYRQASVRGGADARPLDTDLLLYAAELTPEQIADARRRGDAIDAACCRPRDGGS